MGLSKQLTIINKDFKVCGLSIQEAALLKLWGYTLTKWVVSDEFHTVRYRLYYQNESVAYFQDQRKWRVYFDRDKIHKSNLVKFLGKNRVNTYP